MPKMTRFTRKVPLLLSSGLLALGVAQPAQAQSFAGTGEVVLGSALITPTPGQTFIEVNAAETVIDWTAVDFLSSGNIDFQPPNTTATFTNGVSLPSYTVLNRINPLDGNGAPIASTVTFKGTVQSFQDNAIGGNVWFYSPYGVIAGPTAVFNTGSLLLTTSAINISAATTGGTNLFGPAGEIQFRSVTAPGSFVEIQPGAQLTSLTSTALVAPRIQMDGLVSSGGPIAYVAAETLDLRVNGGLFDITVLTGTTDANGITHTGTTTGTASTGATDVQRIAMVAMPVSQALTMLLSGTIGYQPAAVASQDGSSVVLSAGYPTDVPSTGPATQTGSIAIGAAVFRNDLTAFASDAITVAPSAGLAQFSANATLNAAQGITVTGSASATGAFTAITGGLFDVSGTVQGSTVAITSADIAIGANGQIGARGTTGMVTLANANSDAPMNLGGAADGGTAIGYTLDGAELQRIFADSEIFLVNGAGPVTIRDLALSFGAQGNIGTGGALKVAAAGVVRVTGRVALATASANDLFSIDPTLIEVQLDTASIAMTGAGGAPQGRLELVGGTLAIADGATLDAIYGASSLAAISDLLDNPATAAGGNPVLTAGSIGLFVTNALYIQNSGNGVGIADRRGFVAQDIYIGTAGPDTAIAINGQILSGGATINGLDVTPLVIINEVPAAAGGEFNAASTINGCVIGANCIDETPFKPTDTGTELHARLPDGEGALPLLAEFEIIEVEPLIALPLVDEPITGVGNDDLWNSDCAPDANRGEDTCE